MRPGLRHMLPLAGVVVLLSGGGLAALEADTVSSFGDGVWWALALGTTVGFTDPVPVSTGGRVLSGVMMVLGFVLLAMTTAAVTSLFVREEATPAQRRETGFEREALEELRALRERLDAIDGDRRGRRS